VTNGLFFFINEGAIVTNGRFFFFYQEEVSVSIKVSALVYIYYINSTIDSTVHSCAQKSVPSNIFTI
jgi:hypothetical protein